MSHGHTLFFPFWLSLCFITPMTSVNEIASLEIKIPSSQSTIGTEVQMDIIQFILWFNTTVYQYQLNHPWSGDTYTLYTDSALNVIGPSHCVSDSSLFEAKLMIIADDPMGILIDSVKITTISNYWYKIDSFMNVLGQEVDWFCVSKDLCAPPKQITHFDTSQEGSGIKRAVWSDGTNVSPQNTCDPTLNPTMNPTHSPTHTPTAPSSVPTANPTVLPTLHPTDVPNVTPTRFPTLYPTLHPTFNPTQNPSHTPILKLFVFDSTISTTYDYKGSISSNNGSLFTTNRVRTLSVVLGTCVLLVCCIAFGLSMFFKGKKKRPIKAFVDGGAHEELTEWLDISIGLAEYMDNFIQNGYTDMRTVLCINDTSQLDDIGIVKKGHQSLILSEIRKLREQKTHKESHSEIRIQISNAKADELKEVPMVQKVDAQLKDNDDDVSKEEDLANLLRVTSEGKGKQQGIVQVADDDDVSNEEDLADLLRVTSEGKVKQQEAEDMNLPRILSLSSEAMYKTQSQSKLKDMATTKGYSTKGYSTKRVLHE